MNITKRKNIRMVLLSAIMLALAAPIAAQEKSSTDNAPERSSTVSPEAQAVLDRMTTYLKSLKSFSFHSNTTRDEVVAFGFKLQHNESSTIIVKKPNGLRSKVSGDIRDRTFVYNGKNLVMYSPDDNVYTRAPAPDTLGKLIGGLLNAGIELPTIDVLYHAHTGNIAEGVRGGILVGETTIENVVCDHLAFRDTDIDWQIWVEQGSRPLLRKLVITTRYEVGDPQYQTTLHWDLNPKIDSKTFKFSAPKGAVEIPFVDIASINVAVPSGE